MVTAACGRSTRKVPVRGKAVPNENSFRYTIKVQKEIDVADPYLGLGLHIVYNQLEQDKAFFFPA